MFRGLRIKEQIAHWFYTFVIGVKILIDKIKAIFQSFEFGEIFKICTHTPFFCLAPLKIHFFRSESSYRTRKSCQCQCHKKVSKMQDLARPSYIRYLPTLICKDLLVLLSPPVCVGVCTRKTNSLSTSVPI